MISIDWTEAAIARLKEFWAQGLSSAAIGRAMGITKNAVVGKASRLGLPARPSPIRSATGRPPKKAHPYRGAAAVNTARAAMRSSPRLSVVATTRPPQLPTAIPLAAGAGATSSAGSCPPEASAGLCPALSVSSLNLPAGPGLTNLAPAGSFGACRWPLWGHQERPTHRYCEAPRRDALCSYCPDHAGIAYERRQPTGSLAAWNVTERKFHRTEGQGALTAGARFYA